MFTSAGVAHAQANSGALDLRLPIGARGTAMGGAYVSEYGSESVWWNPAGIARVTAPEIALDHFSTFQVESGDAISIMFPVVKVGTFALAARLFNYGSTPTTSETGDDIGESSIRSIVVGGSFATTFGDRLTGGISFRIYDLSTPCTGGCGTAAPPSGTATLDAGLQYRPSATSPLQIGVLLSNVGPDLQVRDAAQADALPTRVHLGATYRPTSTSWDPAIRVRITAEALSTPALSSKEVRMGAELGYQTGETTLFARGGYSVTQVESGSAGPSFGFGIMSKRVQLDITRVIETFSTQLEKPPTFISIRVGL